MKYHCPLCHKPVDADVNEGLVTMYDSDGRFHRCWYKESTPKSEISPINRKKPLEKNNKWAYHDK